MYPDPSDQHNMSEKVTDAKPSDLALQTANEESFETCLQVVTQMFPNVSRDFVQKLWMKDNSEASSTAVLVPTSRLIIEDLLGIKIYPRESARVKELNDRAFEAEHARWKLGHYGEKPAEYKTAVLDALSHFFPVLPTTFIEETYSQHKNFFESFFTIDKETCKGDGEYSWTRFLAEVIEQKKAALRSIRLTPYYKDGGGHLLCLKAEIEAALAHWMQVLENPRLPDTDGNLCPNIPELQRLVNEVATCECCFDTEVPLSKITWCEAKKPHFFCFGCTSSYAENIAGMKRYKLSCMGESGCQCSFSSAERTRVLDPMLVELMDMLQQHDEIRNAGLEGLGDCPFCSFLAADLPPVDIDREFRCQNPECMAVTCRLCEQKTHVPLSCEEFKQQKRNIRHEIDEARTEAFLRTCQTCEARIFKEEGCNKLNCPKCGSGICDVCKQSVDPRSYDHFDREIYPPGAPRSGKCRLYDDYKGREKAEVEAAAMAAAERIRQEHPDLTEEDVRAARWASVYCAANAGA